MEADSLPIPTEWHPRSQARPLPVLDVVRPITESDLDEILGAGRSWAGHEPGKPSIRSLRVAHHQLAWLMSQGREDAEISLICGYSPSRLSLLRTDPTFQELLVHYSRSQSELRVDSMERLKAVGDLATEEILRRLEEKGDEVGLRELAELVKLAHIEPLKASATVKAQEALAAAAAATPAITFQVNLVDSPHGGIAAAPFSPIISVIEGESDPL